MTPPGRWGWVVGVACVVACGGADQRVPGAPVTWRVDSVPLLVLGRDGGDSVGFSTVAGATRLPGGGVLVGDVGDFALLDFSREGRLVRRFGRKGTGPGEIGYLARLFRCGDSVFTQDIDPSRMSVFSLGGDYVRSFRFGAGQPGRAPYASACNVRQRFVHYGWGTPQDIRGGAHRPVVPFWLSGADSAAGPVLGTFPGSERFGLVTGGQLRGTRPLPFGRQSAIAIGPERAYIGTADRYEVLVFDLEGRVVDTLRKDVAPQPTTPADIAYAKERELVASGEKWRAAIERDFAAMPFPATVPAYAGILVDSQGAVWVQEFARSHAPASRWTVFAPDGTLRAEVALPAHLDVYEIGEDYVLGRYLDPVEAVPQVRVYHLVRG